MELDLKLDGLEISKIEVLNLEDSQAMAEGQASVIPSYVSSAWSVIATSTSSV